MKGYLVAIFTILIFGSFWEHLNNELSLISWDVYGYYLYLPAIFLHQDITEYAFAFQHLDEYQVSSALYQLQEVNNVKAPIYTLGMSLIYFPGFIVACVVSAMVGFPLDGMSTPFQWSIIVTSWCWTGIGLFYADRLLSRLKLSLFARFMSIFAVFLGTNFFHYSAYEPGMPHHFLLVFYILICYWTLEWHRDAKMKYLLLLAISISWMVLCRPSEIIAIIIPVGYGIYNGLSFLIKKNRILQNRNSILVALGIFIFILSWQFIFYKLSLGKWFFFGYAGHHFDWCSPHVLEGLLSFRKGWFIYTPIALGYIIGIPLIWKRDRRWFWPILLYTILNIYIVLSWHIWWYASSFGMRALIQSFGVGLIPLAFLVEACAKKSKPSRIVISGIICVLVVMNLFQDWQYRHKILLQDEMNLTYYLKVYGKTEADRMLRRFIDNEYEAPLDKVWNLIDQPIKSNIDTLLNNEFSESLFIPIKENNLLPGDYVRVATSLKYIGNDYDKWNQAKLVTTGIHNDRSIEWRGVRFQQLFSEGQWNIISVDYKIPVGASSLKIEVWNGGPDKVFIKGGFSVFK